MNIRKLFNDEAGVSPIVATLVLVVVAIAGAAAVGTIMGSFSSDVSDQANADNAMSGASTEIIVAGSSTVQPVSELIAKAYMEENPGVKVTVQAGGSSAGIASAGMGIIDIGAASKFMKDSDKKKFPELQEHVIGGSAVVVIAKNNATGADTINYDSLVSLYNSTAPVEPKNGTTNLFGTLTAADPLVVFHRQEASGTEETMSSYLGLGGVDVDGAIPNAGKTIVIDTALGNQGVLDAVIAADTAIGFVDYGFAKKAIADGADIIIVKINDKNGVTYTATDDNVKAEVKERLADKDVKDYYVYGLCRPLVYLTKGDGSSLVNNYINFAMSPASIEAFTDSGYYSINELV